MTTSKNSPGLNPDEAARLMKIAEAQAQTVFKKVPLLGPVAWLMMQQPGTRHLFLADLDWRVMPALVLDQAKLYMREQTPMAFITWAKLSDAAAQRYKQPPHRIGPGDWKSGEQIWIVDLLAPFGNAQDVLKDMRENLFPDTLLRQLAPTADVQTTVLEWPAVKK